MAARLLAVGLLAVGVGGATAASADVIYSGGVFYFDPGAGPTGAGFDFALPDFISGEGTVNGGPDYLCIVAPSNGGPRGCDYIGYAPASGGYDQLSLYYNGTGQRVLFNFPTGSFAMPGTYTATNGGQLTVTSRAPAPAAPAPALGLGLLPMLAAAAGLLLTRARRFGGAAAA